MSGRWRALAFVGVVAIALLPMSAASQDVARPRYPFVFKDVGDDAGLFPHAAGIMGHAAGWGDVDGDGWLDLYVGTFHQRESKPNLFFRNKEGKFRLDEQKHLQISTRATGTLFADLDNDGDLDLYISSMPRPATNVVGCSLFRNDGQGKFTDISKDNGACPAAFGGRSAAVLDYDGDGLLDLLVGEDPIPGYNGSKTKSTRLFRNLGGLKFEDVSRQAGLPENMPGLGVAAADVNNDGWPDFFAASSGGGNRLFLNDRHGKFTEVPDPAKIFHWAEAGGAGGDNMVCGIAFGDVNNDGLLDMVVGPHYSTPWLTPVPVKLYINRGIKDGVPVYEEVTMLVGLRGLPIKAPHVEIQDFDNDGIMDIYTSIVTFAGGKAHPVIFRGLGVKDGLPRFREDALAQIDFPTAEDRKIKRSGEFFDKVIKEKKIIYMAPGPSADFDNDGRLDLFLPNWWVEARSLLLRNETPGGSWLQIQVQGGKGVNKMGVGTRVKVYAAGKLGQPAALLGCQDIASGYGYASAQPAIAHFGLGQAAAVDLEITLPHGKGTVTQKNVAAKQRLTIQP